MVGEETGTGAQQACHRDLVQPGGARHDQEDPGQRLCLILSLKLSLGMWLGLGSRLSLGLSRRPSLGLWRGLGMHLRLGPGLGLGLGLGQGRGLRGGPGPRPGVSLGARVVHGCAKGALLARPHSASDRKRLKAYRAQGAWEAEGG